MAERTIELARRRLEQDRPDASDRAEVLVEREKRRTDPRTGGCDPGVVGRERRAGVLERDDDLRVDSGDLAVDRNLLYDRLGQKFGQCVLVTRSVPACQESAEELAEDDGRYPDPFRPVDELGHLWFATS